MKLVYKALSLSLIFCLSLVIAPFHIYADSGFDSTNYYELNYIQSSGNQYISTGVNNTSNINFEVKASFISLSGMQSIIGSTTSYHQSYMGINGSVYSLRWAEGSTLTGSTDTNFHIYKKDGSTLYYDGTAKGYTGTAYSGTDITLFMQGGYASYSSAKLEYCKIYDGTTLIRNYIPSERKSDGVLGLYDTVNGVFYTNSGTGTFISGGRIVTQYTISTSVSPSGSGTVSGGGTYDSGTVVTLQAIANDGYIFSSWSDGSTSNPRSVTATSNQSYQAIFTQNVTPDPDPPTPVTYSISTSVSPSGSGTVSGGGTYEENTQVSLNAIANEGYTFSSWSNGSTSNPLVITVTGNATYTAVFTQNVTPDPDPPPSGIYTVTLSVSPSGGGTVSGGGTYQANERIEIYASPNNGYAFSSWSDGVVANPRSLQVTSNVNLTAFFVESSGIYENILVGYNAEVIDISTYELTNYYNLTGTISNNTTNTATIVLNTHNWQQNSHNHELLWSDIFILNDQYIGYVDLTYTYTSNGNTVSDVHRVYVNSNTFHYNRVVVYSDLVIDCDFSHLYRNQSTESLIVNGTASSQNSSNNLQDGKDDFTDSSNQLVDIEDGFNDDMNSALQNIDTDFNFNNVFGSKFMASASWVKTQFDRITGSSPFGSVLSFSLLLGLALLLVGKVFK